jgi:hypothetical protein
MVGSQSSGDPVNFKDRQHEGHKGWYVANMTMAANLSLDQKPNLILINCGTNDANPDNHQDVARTGARMKAVLNHLYDSVDGVTIILSTLVPYKQEEANDNVDLINVQYRSLVERLSGEGRKIVLAEMNNGFLDTSTDYFDAIHPNEKGAAKMAAVWDQAILIAEEQGFLTAPIDTDVPDTSTSRCDVEKGQARGPVQTQQGWGYSDGEYKHRETRTGPIAPTQSYSSDHFPEVYFAQLVNAGGADPPFAQDELILCYDNDADFDGPPSTCTMQLNDGSGDFNYSPKIYLELGLDCLTRGIRWGDVNGDGLDDFICINQAGNMYVAINRGDNPPRFEALENGGLIREGYSWAKQDRIRLGDIDGDGRLDYCALDDTGDIFCWRNGGVGDAPTDRYNGYWQSIVCVLSHSLLYLSFFLFLSFSFFFYAMFADCLRWKTTTLFLLNTKKTGSRVSTSSTSTATAEQIGFICTLEARPRSSSTSEETATMTAGVFAHIGSGSIWDTSRSWDPKGELISFLVESREVDERTVCGHVRVSPPALGALSHR